METTNPSYEQAWQELRGILDELAQNQVSMDELPRIVARAKELLRYCRERLRNSEAEVLSLLEDEL